MIATTMINILLCTFLAIFTAVRSETSIIEGNLNAAAEGDLNTEDLSALKKSIQTAFQRAKLPEKPAQKEYQKYNQSVEGAAQGGTADNEDPLQTMVKIIGMKQLYDMNRERDLRRDTMMKMMMKKVDEMKREHDAKRTTILHLIMTKVQAMLKQGEIKKKQVAKMIIMKDLYQVRKQHENGKIATMKMHMKKMYDVKKARDLRTDNWIRMMISKNLDEMKVNLEKKRDTMITKIVRSLYEEGIGIESVKEKNSIERNRKKAKKQLSSEDIAKDLAKLLNMKVY